MAYVYDIRGTHGSGKSSVAMYFITKYAAQMRHHPKFKLYFYELPALNMVVVGKYTSQCGGADTVKRVDDVEAFVRQAVAKGKNVLVEGILVSHTFGRWNSVAHDLGVYRFFHLNPPLEECIARVESRRAIKGNTEPFDPKNVIKDHAQIARVCDRLKAEGHTVYRLTRIESSTATAQRIERIIKEEM